MACRARPLPGVCSKEFSSGTLFFYLEKRLHDKLCDKSRGDPKWRSGREFHPLRRQNWREIPAPCESAACRGVLHSQSTSEVVVGLGVIRFEADDFLELPDRLVGLTFPDEGGAEVAVGLGNQIFRRKETFFYQDFRRRNSFTFFSTTD
jgi:hypothetical protein